MNMKKITTDEYKFILKKEKLSREDRLKLQSVVVYPLASACSDLSATDYERIYFLEEKNLYRVLNVACMLAGQFGDDIRSQLLGLPLCQSIIRELKPGSDVTERESKRNTYMMIMRCALSNFNSNLRTPVVFDGKMPQKLFQFRQQTANTWFEDLVGPVSFIAGSLYADLGLEEASLYVMGYIAYYLNQSQSGKYGIDMMRDDNDNIFKILSAFVCSVSGDSRSINPSLSKNTII